VRLTLKLKYTEFKGQLNKVNFIMKFNYNELTVPLLVVRVSVVSKWRRCHPVVKY